MDFMSDGGVGAGAGERRLGEALVSEQWDRTCDRPPHTRYAIFALMRTGSGLLCADLRQRGLGVPHEYFQSAIMPQMAQRLGVLDPDGRIALPRFMTALSAKRTTPNGIFGIKIQAAQLSRIVNGNAELGGRLLAEHDKIVLLRRRDTLMQAISLMRSLTHGRWHLIADDKMPRTELPDDVLFARITHCWAQVIDEDRYLHAAASRLDPSRVRAVWYEDLGDERVRQGLAQWLGEKTSGVGLPPPVDNPWPKKNDPVEAEEIRQRFMAFIGASGMTPPG
jgi:LPS sulfotransferase NodH